MALILSLSKDEDSSLTPTDAIALPQGGGGRLLQNLVQRGDRAGDLLRRVVVGEADAHDAVLAVRQQPPVQQPQSLDPFVGTRSLLFPGGCIEYRYRFAEGSASALVIEADRALSSVPRTEIVAEVRKDLDLSLCGAGATKCAG